MITLEQFIDLCNLEGAYTWVSHEDKENYCSLELCNLPNFGLTLDRITKYYNRIVENVNIVNCNNYVSIHIALE